MRTAVRLVVLLVLALTAFAPPAFAGPEDDRKAAEKLTQDGLQLARNKKFREAIAKFESALKLFPHPEIQHNLARAHEELGELKTAYDYYSQALKHDYTFAADGRQRLQRIEGELRKSYGRLTVRTTPSQVAVVLKFPDGKEERQSLAPFTTWVPAGRIKISGTNPNFRTKEETLDIAAGEDRELQLTLTPLPRQGFLVVRVNIVGATISLAGQPLGKSPLDSVTYEAGVYQLDVRARGYKPHSQEVVIVQDEVQTVQVSLELDKTVSPEVTTTSGVPSWVGWTLVGVGAAAGGAALYLQFGVARPAQEDANGLPQVPAGVEDTEYERLHKKAVKYQTAALITGIVGGVAAATGAYLLIFAPETTDEAKAPTWVPSFAVTPDGAGLGATVRF